MLTTILFAIIILFVIIINFIFFFTTSGKEMVREITDQQIISRIGLIAVYFPALFARFIINLCKKSYRKHKAIYEFIGEFVTISMVFVIMFAWYILLYALGL